MLFLGMQILGAEAALLVTDHQLALLEQVVQDLSLFVILVLQLALVEQ
jgi:hypothetical protein